MLTLAPPPTTSLARVVRDEREVARADRKRRSKVRRALRILGVAVAAFYFIVGFGAGSAQAGPIDDAIQHVKHFCGPMDVPSPSSHEGIDNAFGLNDVEDSKLRATVRTSVDEDLAKKGGNGIERLRSAYSADDQKSITAPTYERYGFNSLRWTNYGASCFGPGYWFSPITNFAFVIFVKFPMILGMGFLNLALDPNNLLYQAFALILSPFARVLTAIFEPWVYIFAPLGVLWVWIKSKASVQATLQALVWVIAIVGVFLWMGRSTSTIVTAANNVVTDFTGAAACHMLNADADKTNDVSRKSADAGDCGDDTGLSQINQALWHGVPYQTWLVGEVGSAEAQDSAKDEAEGRLGWGPAILNGLYLHPSDDGGKRERAAIEWWNSANYKGSSDADSKVGWWTGGDDNLPDDLNDTTAWGESTFLATVKMACNDQATDEGGNDGEDNNADDEKTNRWMYKGWCDTAGAGTSDFVPYFKGDEYAHQMVVAFAGGWATLAVVLAIGLAAVYLMLQKLLFFFLLAVGPIFLAFSTFADEKRRQFATRYFELLAANVVKQVVAVCVVLFVSYSMSALMNPPAGSDFPNIPWMAKPIFAMLFFIALVIFMIPMKNLMKAVAKGDVSVVDKVANAPADYAKKTAKGAAIAAAVVATGGAAAAAGAAGTGGAAGAASSLGKTGMAMRQAGSVLGRRGGVGKFLTTTGRMNTLASGMLNNKAAKASEKEANRQGALMLARANPGKYQTDTNGQLTPQGMAAATAEFKKTSAEGVRHKQSKQLAQQQMQNFFAGHLAQTGERHVADPEHFDNQRSASNGHGDSGRSDGAGTHSGPKGIDIPETPYQPAEPNYQADQYFVDTARARVDQPYWGRDDITIQSVTPGTEVLGAAGLSEQRAMENPLLLVNGDSPAYDGGDVTQMDPTHTLTPILHRLRQVVATGDERYAGDAQALVDEAVEVIAAHGVPDRVQGVRAIHTSAFEPAEVVGAMPNLDERAGWRDRAEASYTMQAAVTAIPESHPAAEVADGYVRALADPSIGVDIVEGLRAQVISALADTTWRPSERPTEPPTPLAPDPKQSETNGPRSDQPDEDFRPQKRGRSGMYDYDDEDEDEMEDGGKER